MILWLFVSTQTKNLVSYYSFYILNICRIIIFVQDRFDTIIFCGLILDIFYAFSTKNISSKALQNDDSE